MPVMLGKKAKKGLVKYLQSQINHHIDTAHPERVTIGQVGEWLARGLGYQDQNELAIHLNPASRKHLANTPEERLNSLANYQARSLISEIEDSALDSSEGWTVLLLKYAHLCVSLFHVDTPLAELTADEVNSYRVVQMFFSGYLAGPFNAQSPNYSTDPHWPIWNMKEKHEVLMMLSNYSDVVYHHKCCPSLSTCVSDHSEALAITYESLQNKLRLEYGETLFTAASILVPVAEEIARVGEKMALTMSPRRDLLMAMLVAQHAIEHDIEHLKSAGYSEQSQMKKCRG